MKRLQPIQTVMVVAVTAMIISLMELVSDTLPPTFSPQPIFFQTKSYGVEIIWRNQRPYLTVSNNNFRVLSNVLAKEIGNRGSNDDWKTYSARSGDYLVNVRVNSIGTGLIEVKLGNQTTAKEYARALRRKQEFLAVPTSTTVLAFQTSVYAVKVYRQKGNLRMNLYNRKLAITELKQVSVKQISVNEGMVYRYDGDATIQVRADNQGRRSLMIMRDNQVQYRGEGF